MRAYTVATAAVALEMPRKWIDNTLSHFRVPGVHQSTQGVARRLNPHAVLTLAIGLRLIRDLGLPLQVALDLGNRLAQIGGPEARITLGEDISIQMNVLAVARAIDSRLAHAVEVTPTPRRGRPPNQVRRLPAPHPGSTAIVQPANDLSRSS